jgi:hypothetical protein
MNVVLAIAVLILLALVSAGVARRALGNRFAAMAVSGLWGAGLVGVVLGPRATGLVNAGTRDAPGTLDLATPLIMVTLGWIGMMVGLQVRRDVVPHIPRSAWRMVALDAAVTVLAWGPIVAVAVPWAMPDAELDARVGVSIALIAAMLGWSSETRSVRPLGVDGATSTERAVRSAGALSSILAIGVFGLGLIGVVGARRMLIDPDAVGIGVLGAAAGIVIAVVGGALLGRIGLSLAGRSRGNQLVAFLGTLTLVAGIAAKIGVSSLLCAGIVGTIIGNAKGFGAREFERYLLRAEIAVATLLGLLVGVVAASGAPGREMVLAGAIVAWRAIVKPMVARRGSASAPMVVRAHPIGLAIALGLTLHVERSAGAQMCAIVLASALGADLVARAWRWWADRSASVVPDAAGAPA